ncbi:hypothetical protein MKX01_011600 [Papaver californicum]|nr:hypothetical protein MKX01_011600 [Papaver californicum]
MDKENEKSKNQQEKGTENHTNHLPPSDKSMEMKLKYHLINGKTPASDNYIMCNILSRFRSKYLMRFKSVCSQWKSMIETDSYLIDLQYRFHGRDKKPLLFISSAPSLPKEIAEGIIDFTSDFLQLHVGPTEVQKLELDRSNFGISKQTVAGLVCITASQGTPWIETPNVKVHCIAFGYSPRTKEHKVLCISTVKRKGVGRGLSDGKKHALFDHAYDSEVGVDEEQVYEVFNVGENTWRRIDAVPPYSLVSKVCHVGDLGQYNEESESVYVSFKIYWRFLYTHKGKVLMVFDVRTEKFKVISIPEYVTKVPWEHPQTVELLEVDGHIAVLKFTHDCPISLWILDQDDGSDEWSYEEVKKMFNSFTVNQMYELNYQSGELREILTLVDSLAPVRTKRCSMCS